MTTFAPHRDTLEYFVDCRRNHQDRQRIVSDEDGKIAEVSIFYRTLPAGVALQRNLAEVIGKTPWELSGT